ncbi:MAG: hypothetical protein HRT71_05715 [Flavobacteriales bacterium]|nr:hypothetical protein [Flavobacteriales bacterium]
MKKALIVFSDEWLQYSPTILNAIKCLEPTHKVTVLSCTNHVFPKETSIPNVHRIHTGKLLSWILRKLKSTKKFKFWRMSKAIEKLKTQEGSFDLVIGTDSMGYLLAKRAFVNPVFLSLEIKLDEHLIESKRLGIDHLIIQSEPRKDFLVGELSNVNVHYIQNAPIINSDLKKTAIDDSTTKKLIYLGNIDKGLHLDECIKCLYQLDESYTLTLKGIRIEHYYRYLKLEYADLIKANRLLIDYDYLDQNEIIYFLRSYYIGFAFYDFSGGRANDFNYLSSPSGKIFNYFAAGIPVIAHDIIGMKPVTDFNCGKLLKPPTPESLAKAICDVEANYKEISSNCEEAAKQLDFKLAFDKFLKSFNSSTSLLSTAK